MYVVYQDDSTQIKEILEDEGLAAMFAGMFCSMLQCVAVCCGVLRCVAVCCSVLQCVAVCCSVLQCVVVVCCRRGGPCSNVCCYF